MFQHKHVKYLANGIENNNYNCHENWNTGYGLSAQVRMQDE